MTTLEILTAVALAAIVVATVFWLAARSERSAREALNTRDGDPALRLMQQQIDAMRGQMSEALQGSLRLLQEQLTQSIGQVNDRLRENAEAVSRTNQTLGERLDNASRVVGEVQKSLGGLGEATARVYEVGKDIASLQEILRSPKLRGGLGELLLGELLAQILPPEHFTLQHEFRSGEKVDAVIRIGDGLVPVDAKFPLEDSAALSRRRARRSERRRAKRFSAG